MIRISSMLLFSLRANHAEYPSGDQAVISFGNIYISHELYELMITKMARAMTVPVSTVANMLPNIFKFLSSSRDFCASPAFIIL